MDEFAATTPSSPLGMAVLVDIFALHIQMDFVPHRGRRCKRNPLLHSSLCTLFILQSLHSFQASESSFSPRFHTPDVKSSQASTQQGTRFRSPITKGSAEWAHSPFQAVRSSGSGR